MRSLKRLGHSVEGFIRNVPLVFGWQARESQRFTGAKTLAALIAMAAHRVPRMQPDFVIRNRRFTSTVARLRPDAIIITGGNHVIFPETLAQVKKHYGCKVIYICADSPILFAHALERAAAPLYDLVLVNDYYHGIQWCELGSPRMEVLPLSACDPVFHRPCVLTADEQKTFAANVGFVGTLVPPKLYSERVAALEAVREFGLGVWSIHGVPPSIKDNLRGPALGERMLKAICGSKIQLNPHGNSMRYGGNMRLFEAAGCGVFQISDDRPGTPQWLEPGKEIILYKDLDHLRKLADYYLRHDDERQAIAGAAQERAYRDHTYDQRMRRLVEMVDLYL